MHASFFGGLTFSKRATNVQMQNITFNEPKGIKQHCEPIDLCHISVINDQY